MIVTVTLAPALDRTYAVTELTPGELHRAHDVRVEASGKGINITRLLRARDVASLALFPAEEGELTALLRADDVPYVRVETDLVTRTNTTVLDTRGTTTKLNSPAQGLDSATANRLSSALASLVRGHRVAWVVISGATPAGNEHLLERLVGVARDGGTRVAVDTSGPGLVAALAAGVDLVKPNADELAELTGIDTPDDDLDVHRVAEAARRLVDTHGVTVLATLGRHGAVYADTDLLLHGASPRIAVVNSTGAGDAALAGWLSSADPVPVGRLRSAVSAGASACLSAATAAWPERPISPQDVTVGPVHRSPPTAHAPTARTTPVSLR